MKKFLFSLLLGMAGCLFLGCSQPTIDDVKNGDDLGNRYLVRTEEIDSKEAELPDQQIEVDGRKYNLVDYSDEIKDLVMKTDTKTLEKKNILDDSADFPEKEDIDGTSYELTDVQYTKEELRTQKVTDQRIYTGETPDETISQTVTDDLTGEDINVTLYPTNTVTEEIWTDDFQLPLTFYDYDAYTYYAGSELITADDNNIYYQGKENALLAAASLDPEDYIINYVVWNGPAYQGTDSLQRNAIAYGRRKITEYTVDYEGIAEFPQTYTATATYTAEIPEESHFILHRTMIYEHSYPILGLSLGAAIFLAFILILIFVIKKKDKNGKEKGHALSKS